MYKNVTSDTVAFRCLQQLLATFMARNDSLIRLCITAIEILEFVLDALLGGTSLLILLECVQLAKEQCSYIAMASRNI